MIILIIFNEHIILYYIILEKNIFKYKVYNLFNNDDFNDIINLINIII